MKKIMIGALAVLTIVFMILSTIPVTVSEGGARGSLKTLYQEDFKADNGQYKLDGTSGNRWSWLAGQYWQTSSGTRVNYIVSPTIDLSKGTKNGQISWRNYQSSASLSFSFYVAISNDNGATWKQIYYARPTGWTGHTLPFTDDYLVNAFRVKFGGGHPRYGWGGWRFYVDDIKIEAEAGIPAIVDVQPTTLNLDSMGNYINIKVEDFPDNPEYSPTQVDRDTVEVEGIGVDLKFGTWNDNKFICKADRLLVEDAIGAPGDAVELAVSGDVGDTSFEGFATLRAIQN